MQTVYDDMHVYVLVLLMIQEIELLWVSKGKLLIAVPEAKIVEREDVISWS